jgi:hypothetical protein
VLSQVRVLPGPPPSRDLSRGPRGAAEMSRFPGLFRRLPLRRRCQWAGGCPRVLPNVSAGQVRGQHPRGRLRGGLPWLLLWVPPGARSARCAGRPPCRDLPETSELGARCGYPGLFRCHGPSRWMPACSAERLCGPSAWPTPDVCHREVRPDGAWSEDGSPILFSPDQLNPVRTRTALPRCSAQPLWRVGDKWIVDAVFQGADGVVYAQLVCATDLTQQKTLSVRALTDRRRFQRL